MTQCKTQFQNNCLFMLQLFLNEAFPNGRYRAFSNGTYRTQNSYREINSSFNSL